MDEAPRERGDRSLLDLVDVLGRWRYSIVVAIGAVSSVAHGFRSDGDWPVFRRAAYLLFGREARWLPLPGGLRMFANYPEVQIGPLSAVVAAPFVPFGTVGRQLAAAFLMVIGIVAWVVVDRSAERTGPEAADSPASGPSPSPTADRVRRRELSSLIAGVLVVVAWLPLAGGYLHVDDALAMLACVAAVSAILGERPVAAGVLLGAAVGAKPWAILFGPMLLALPSMRPRAILGFAVAAAACWAPFVIADPSTLSAAKPTVDVAEASVLHLFGVPRGLAPEWVRAPQLLVGLFVGLVAVWRGRWLAVPMVVIATRLVLDPGVFTYYTSALVLAAALWDLLGHRNRVPWASAVAFVGLDVVAVVAQAPAAQAVVRLVTCGALVVSGLTVAPKRPATRAEPSELPEPRLPRSGAPVPTP